MTLNSAARARAPWAITIFCLSAPLFTAAGGLALSPLLALAGVAAFPGWKSWRRAGRFDPAGWLFFALLIWIGVAQAWSPSPPEQVVLVWAGALLYGAAVLAASELDEPQRRIPRAAMIAMLIGLGVLLLIEVATGAMMTRMTKGLEPGDPLVFRNVSRAASVYVVLLGPVAALALLQAPAGRWIAFGLALAGIPIAGSFDMLANLAALVAAGLVFLTALRWPFTTLAATGIAIALWIVLFPFIVSIIGPLSEAQRAALPFSWEWRWETWSYARDLIGQKPIVGWGMDSARSFEETIQMRGYTVDRMPLHPHSSALQLWLETGVIGALLAAGAAAALGAESARRLRDRRWVAAGAASAMMAAAVLSFVSYGVWQEWWWATAYLAVMALMLTAPARRIS